MTSPALSLDLPQSSTTPRAPGVTAPSVLALDLSLVATGWAKSDTSSGVLRPADSMRGMRRVQWVLNAVVELLAGVDVVAIEGYAFGAKGRAVFDIAELGGVIRFTIFEAPYPVVEIPPSNLKMFATGSGNAAKNEVFAAAIRKLSYAGNDHNEADALWLLDMATAHYEGRTLTAKQQQALAKIHWPTLTVSGHE